ncbi:MAG: prepilin peptidase [Spirochaetes bacterium]|nr:prepilin peptidase [Spirochaetota bacterium]
MNQLLIFFFGAVLGSFFYTLAVRFVNGSFAENKYKALFGSSKCPKCGHRINPVFLIPIVGLIILRGKCRECGGSISKIYPLMEILFGVLSCFIYYKLSLSIYSIIIFLIIGVSIAVSIVDIKILAIPNSLIIVFILLSVYPVILNDSLKDNLYGFLLMGLFFAAVLLIFPGSFGGGDVKFAAAIGILLGFDLSIVALETALIVGSLIGVIYAVKSRKGFRIRMPFAPFLSAGLFVSLLYGRDILLVYYRIFY